MKKILNSIVKGNYIAYIIPIAAFILLKNPIEDWLSNTVVAHLLSKIESVWYNDIIFLLPLLYLIAYLIHQLIHKKCKFDKELSNYALTINLFILAITYTFYRCTDNDWEFYSFTLYPFFKYTDIIWTFPFISLLRQVYQKPPKKKNEADAFFIDKPIDPDKPDELDELDELGYAQYTKVVADRIRSSHFKSSFAIGINGKWGIGKTSFMHLLKKDLKGNDKFNDEIINIDFDPWKSNSPKAIIQDFFETFQEAIESPLLSRVLTNYSDKLVSLDESSAAKTIISSINILKGAKSLKQVFDSVNSILEKTNKKIVIYIDDLDRLDKEEIIEIIRLIRNTANFHNTFFIVAYDRNYIVKALEDLNSYNKENFLEKIFQLEITLPYFKKQTLRNKLAKKLKQKLSNEHDLYNHIEKSIVEDDFYIFNYLNEWLENMRDVTRLANAIVLNLTKIKGEVEFDDFLRLELLKLKYPSVHSLLFKKTEKLLISKGLYYQLKKENDDKEKKNIQGSTSNTNSKDTTILEKYLVEHYDELSIPKNDIQKIVDFIDEIFSPQDIYRIKKPSHLSVVNSNKFYLYFTYRLLTDILSEVEFKEARALNQEDFNIKIKEWVNEGLEKELKQRFYDIKEFVDKEDFEKTISTIFYLASLNSKENDDLVEYNSKDLYEKILYKGKKLYKEESTLDEFLKGLFQKAKSPYLFEAGFIRAINNELNFAHDSEEGSLPFLRNRLLEIALDYLDKYTSSIDKIVDDDEIKYEVFSLFHCCKYTERIKVNDNTYQREEIIPSRAKQILSNFFLKKDFDGFLFAMMQPEPFNKDSFAVNQFVLQLFDNWKDFKDTLDKQIEEDWKYLREFKDFFVAFAAKGYNTYIPFDFKVIPIEKKRNDN